jgi:hypothetical protein
VAPDLTLLEQPKHLLRACDDLLAKPSNINTGLLAFVYLKLEAARR